MNEGRLKSVSERAASLLALADGIESEMRRIKLWDPGLRVEPSKSYGPFGNGPLTFEEWLQGIFLPRLRQTSLSESWPRFSEVATAAQRNLDGMHDTQALLNLLRQVDRLINDE